MQLLASPWADNFEHFARSIRHSAILVTPFIARGPLQRLSAILNEPNSLQVDILTNFAVDSLLQGSVDVKSIAEFCRDKPNASVRHLPGLHAKAYVADESLAIITSGNLTNASLTRNYEYGVEISDENIVREISQDLRDYGALGSLVSLSELEQISEVSEGLQAKYGELLIATRASVRQEFERQLGQAQDNLRYLRAKPGESTNAIFSRTILYVLRNGPLSTSQIHSLIEGIHPDICDDSIDRVINGVHFGKRWKHMVRNAQQSLKDRGLISLVDRKWCLAE